MRLIFFIPLLSTKGGQERTLVDKANWLAEIGHEVLFVTYVNDGPLAYPLNPKIKHTDLACHFFQIYRCAFYRRFWRAFKLKRVFRHKMKEVVSAFQPDIIAVAIPLTEFFLNDLVKISGNIPIVVESHLTCGYEAVTRGFTEKVLDLFYSPQKAIRKTDLLVALTEEDAKKWCKFHHRVCVIPNPLTHFIVSLPCVEKSEGRILCVGRLSPQKRYDRMVNAFAMIADIYPKWHVDIYGGGQEQGASILNKLVCTKGLEGRVHIFPPVDDIYSEYLRSQFLVLSSDFEGFGLVIIEAMACGIPVVATDCPSGPSEIIEDRKTGLLAKMDEKDLAEKIEWMITHEEERKRMGALAYEASAKYKKDLIIPQWEKAYMSVIK